MPQSVIVIDATIGGVSTNSYLSLADFELLIHQRPFHSAWDKINDDDVKKAALIWGTTILSNLQYKGAPTSSTQKLPWPRTGIYDYDGREYDSDSYPDWFITAFVEVVFNAAINNTLSDTGLEGISELKIGPISIKTDPSDRPDIIPGYILENIKFWLKGGYKSISVSLVRV